MHGIEERRAHQFEIQRLAGQLCSSCNHVATIGETAFYQPYFLVLEKPHTLYGFLICVINSPTRCDCFAT